MMSTSRLASCLRIANISSCLRMVLAFSTSSSSANVRSSVGDLDFKSWSFISRMRVVLGGYLAGAFQKWAGRNKGGNRRIRDEIGRLAFGLMRRPVPISDRTRFASAAVRGAGEGCDFAVRRARGRGKLSAGLKWFHHRQNHDSDHQQGG